MPESSKFCENAVDVRRSRRRPHCILKEEDEGTIIKKIVSMCQDGLTIRDFPMKGRGIVAVKKFKSGEFVTEYRGDLIDMSEAKIREEILASQNIEVSYMYYFQHNNASFCIDATNESESLGRLINHSRMHPNLTTRLKVVCGKPRLVFFAKKDIAEGTELLYDYGDRRKIVQKFHPWLKC